MTTPVIHWFRRDLRIADNTALYFAAKPGNPVIPLYITSDWSGDHHWTGPNRQQFLCGSLEVLDDNLRQLEGRLIVRQGDPVEELRKLIRETGASEIHFNEDPDPFGKSMERKIFTMCKELGVTCHAHPDVSFHAPGQVLTGQNQPYKVFTPYCRNWLGLEKASPFSKPRHLGTPDGIASLPLPTLATWKLSAPDAEILPPGEQAAKARLKKAVSSRLETYDQKRDLPAEDGTSRLSQDLRYGLLSVRTVYEQAMKASASASASGKKAIDVFIKELAWREFYFAVLDHFPEVLDLEFNPDWRGLPWSEPGKNFEAWKQGRTGFPIVDAGMRQLLGTGFMHNRVRMITAMFLTKDLHIDWRLGESWFMQHLVDGEIGSNNGGWQWSAGTGADAAPYFRIQNPWTQTSRYDPDGVYIKRWIPELAEVDPKQFLAPPRNGRPIASGYPVPIVDHKTERERTLEIFKRHRAKKR